MRSIQNDRAWAGRWKACARHNDGNPRQEPHDPHLNSSPALMDCGETCRFFGGSKPINASTLYRGIKGGRFPRPVKIGPGLSRWVRAECQRALELMMAERHLTRDGSRPLAGNN
jgi:predicted DNA-binding transcriptional regulator AlpA